MRLVPIQTNQRQGFVYKDYLLNGVDFAETYCRFINIPFSQKFDSA